MKTFLATILFLTSILNLNAHPNTNPETLTEQGLDQLINKATRQNMLCLRIAKCYFAVGMNIEPKFYQLQLADATSTYKKQITDLKMAAPTPEIQEGFRELEILFADYERLTSTTVERANAQEVLTVADQLTNLCNKMVGELSAIANALPQNLNGKINNKEYTSLLMMVGDNRMLTQRVPLLYLANLWEINTESNKAQIDEMLVAFSRNLQEIQKITQNTSTINEYIFTVMGEWRFVAESCMYWEEQNRAEAFRLLEKSDVAANSIHKLAGLYEKLFNLDAGSLSNQGKN